MTDAGRPLNDDEVAVIPGDRERGLALVLGAEVIDAESWQIPKGMVADAITIGGLLGGASAETREQIEDMQYRQEAMDDLLDDMLQDRSRRRLPRDCHPGTGDPTPEEYW